jgi:hypothetical protein
MQALSTCVFSVDPTYRWYCALKHVARLSALFHENNLIKDCILRTTLIFVKVKVINFKLRIYIHEA